MQHFWFRTINLRNLKQINRIVKNAKFKIYTSSIDPAISKFVPDFVEVIPLSLSVEDDTGCNIRARCEELGAIFSRRLASTLIIERLPSSQRPWAAEWMRAYGSYLHEEIKPLAEFLAFVENLYLIGKLNYPEKIVINLDELKFSELIAPEIPQALRMRCVVSVEFVRKSMALMLSKALVYFLLKMMYLILRCYLKPPPDACLKSNGGSVILVEFHDFTKEYFPLGAQQDWYEYSGLPAHRLVFYFHRTDSPLSKKTISWLHERGFSWIDAMTPALWDRRPVSTTIYCIRNLYETLPSLLSLEGRYHWLFFVQELPRLQWQRAVLRYTNAIAIFQHSDFVPHVMTLAIACRQEEVAFVWSYSSVLVFFTAADHHAIVDLFLAWGPLDLAYSNAQSFEYRHAVQCGILGYEGAEKNDKYRAKSVRDRLEGNPKFVIGVFDSSHTESSIHHSTDRCVLFYKTILGLVSDNPAWGCIIKSKGLAFDHLPLSSGIYDLATELENQGRFLRLQSSAKPSIVGMASDLVVSFSINSAGFLASIGSRRLSLHFDPNLLNMHPLVMAGCVGKIIFNDTKSFVDAINNIASGHSGIGDISPWSMLIDPFQDGLGRQRSGEVMNNFVLARDRGDSLETALSQAVQFHAHKYGERFVSTRFSKHEDAATNLWSETKKRRYKDWPLDYPYSVTVSKPSLK